MLIHIRIFAFTLLYLFILDGIQRVVSDDNVVKEDEKSLSTFENENRFYFTLSKDKLMWKDAYRACKTKGMSLASFDTPVKVEAFHSIFERESLINRDGYNENGEYWVGGFREDNELARFKWINEKLVGSFGWAVGKPNYSSNQYCLEIKLTGDLWLWNDVVCDKLSRYICMYEAADEKTKNKAHVDEDTKKPNNHEEGNKNLVTVNTIPIAYWSHPEMFRRVASRPIFSQIPHSFSVGGPMYNYDYYDPIFD